MNRIRVEPVPSLALALALASLAWHCEKCLVLVDHRPLCLASEKNGRASSRTLLECLAAD